MIATGTIGAPLSSASRPIPRRGLDESSPVRERPPSAYMAIVSPRSRIVDRGGERLLVGEAAPHREDAAVRVDLLHRRLEQLRLGHEVDLAPQRHAEEEVIQEREVIRRQDHRPDGRDALRVRLPARKKTHAIRLIRIRTTS